jgi:hypothetical protein
VRLIDQLRHAGVTPEQAEELAHLWDQVRLARYSPVGMNAPEALARQVDAALAKTGLQGAAQAPRWRTRTGLLGLLLLTLAVPARAQTAPEQLYQAGAYTGAEQGFRRQLDASPDSPSLWFNLGAAAYRAGDDAVALAAWTQGARLAPRDAGLRRALLLLPPADVSAARWLWVAPLAPSELLLVGLVCWLAGWAGVLVTRRFRGRWLVLLGGGVLLIGLGLGLGWWYRASTAVVATNATLRLSPHELAPPVGEVPKLGTVRVDLQRGGWWRVRATGGQTGWIRQNDVALVAPPSS